MWRPPQFILDREGSRRIDREATARYGMPSLLLMENAALALAGQVELLTMERSNRQVLIVCGSGNNGGDGYALARHLHNRGCALEILTLAAPRAGTDALINFEICATMGLTIASLREDLMSNPRDADLIVDAIFGTGLDRPVEGEVVEFIEWINWLERPVLAADIPSGLDCDTGQALGIAVRATKTISFAGMKKGFVVNKDSRRYTGDVIVGDIGVPIELIRECAVNESTP